MTNANKIRAQAKQELQRADIKATSLITVIPITVAAVAVLVEIDDLKVPTISMVGLGISGLLLLASMLLMLDVIRPRTGGEPHPGTWLHVARNGVDVAHEKPSDRAIAEEAALLAASALRKYRKLTCAVWLLTAAVLTLAVSLALIPFL